MAGNLQYLLECYVIGEVNLRKLTCSHNSLQFYVTSWIQLHSHSNLPGNSDIKVASLKCQKKIIFALKKYLILVRS